MSHQMGEALVPVVVGVIIDRAVERGDGGALAWWLLALVGVFALLSNSYRFGARFVVLAEKHAAHDVRVAVTRRILAPEGGVEAHRLPGELVTIATADAQQVGWLCWTIGLGAAAAAALVTATVFLFAVSVPLGLLVLAGLPPCLLVLHLLTRPLVERSADQQEGLAQAVGVAVDLLSGLRILKGLGAERTAAHRYRATSRASLTATLRAARFEAITQGAAVVLTGGFVAVVALVGGRLAADGQMSIGDLVAAAGLTQFLIGPFSRISMVIAELARSRASAGRIAAVLSAPAAVASGAGTVPAPARGAVELHHVATGSLQDVSFTVEPGEVVGVAALVPSDAQALIACLARDVDPETGTLAIDGVDFALLDLDDLRAALVVAHHHSHLFGGRLIDNVRAATADGTDVTAALAASATDEVASTLPDGFETEMTERGRSLSGGQHQRVTLARALAADPPVLVLHDPTTAVDAATEATIADGLLRLRAGRTTILVTTSPGLLAITDRVVVIEDGRTVDEGTHATLLARTGRYRSVVVA